jgi:hypothetical protein
MALRAAFDRTSREAPKILLLRDVRVPPCFSVLDSYLLARISRENRNCHCHGITTRRRSPRSRIGEPGMIPP